MWRQPGIEPIPLDRSFLDQTTAWFPLFYSIKRNEEGFENKKMSYEQVQRITKAVKVVEVKGTTNALLVFFPFFTWLLLEVYVETRACKI